MDDPWIPQFAAAGILEDLGQHGIVGDAGFAKPFLDLGYWPPRQGPRIKGFENKKPTLVALPTIGDLQTMTYRNDVYKTAPKTWHELVTVGQAAMKAGHDRGRDRLPRRQGQPDRDLVVPDLPELRRQVLRQQLEGHVQQRRRARPPPSSSSAS